MTTTRARGRSPFRRRRTGILASIAAIAAMLGTVAGTGASWSDAKAVTGSTFTAADLSLGDASGTLARVPFTFTRTIPAMDVGDPAHTFILPMHNGLTGDNAVRYSVTGTGVNGLTMEIRDAGGTVRNAPTTGLTTSIGSAAAGYHAGDVYVPPASTAPLTVTITRPIDNPTYTGLVDVELNLVFTPDLAVQNAPVIATAVAGDKSAAITWNNDPEAVSYTVTGAPAFTPVVVPNPGASTASLAGLINGTTYAVSVTANFPSGGVKTSSSIDVTPKQQLALHSVSVGKNFTCALSTSRAAWCWGSNTLGQLGDGTTGQSAVPVAALGGVAFNSVDAGDEHACGLTASGVAYCWGSNSHGQLGDVTYASKTAPVAVSGGKVFTSISAGSGQTCAITPDGAAYCWGDQGSVGTNTPDLVPGGHVFDSISAGEDHQCGLDPSGVVWCWGRGGSGQLGSGSAWAQADPISVPGGPYSLVTTGEQRGCALTAAGASFCWGANGGAFGNGLVASVHYPTATYGSHVFKSLVTGGAVTCGTETTGAAYCWGSSYNGQRGDGLPTPTYAPGVAVLGGHVFASVSTGENSTCGVDADGASYCWGDNTSGQVGDGTNTHRLYPVAVTVTPPAPPIPFSTWVRKSGGTGSSVSFSWANTPWATGYEYQAQVKGTGWSAPVSVGASLSASVTGSTGDLIEIQVRAVSAAGTGPWSATASGVVRSPLLVVSNSNTCGLTSVGLAYCWGLGGNGQIGNGSTSAAYAPTPVSGGHVFTSLVTADPTYNGYSQNGGHTCGLDAAGSAWCWGPGSGGILGDSTGNDRSVPTLVAGF